MIDIARRRLGKVTIVVDCRCLAREYRGIAQYTYNLVKALGAYKEIQLRVIALKYVGQRLPFGKGMEEIAIPDEVKVEGAIEQRLEEKINVVNPDCVLLTSWFSPATPFPESLDHRATVLVHDLIPYYLHKPKKGYLYQKARLERVFRVLSTTTYTNACLRNEGITSTPIGVGTSKAPSVSPHGAHIVRRKFRLRKGYMFCQTAYDMHKGLEYLVASYAALPHNTRLAHQLVIGSSPPPKLAERCKALDVVVTGRLSEPDKAALHDQAWLFIFPSIMEGFGMPVAEALSHSTPVIVGDNSALREHILDPRFRFGHADGSLSKLIIALASQPELYNDCVEHGEEQRTKLLSWDAVAHNLVFTTLMNRVSTR